MINSHIRTLAISTVYIRNQLSNVMVSDSSLRAIKFKTNDTKCSFIKSDLAPNEVNVNISIKLYNHIRCTAISKPLYVSDDIFYKDSYDKMGISYNINFDIRKKQTKLIRKNWNCAPIENLKLCEVEIDNLDYVNNLKITNINLSKFINIIIQTKKALRYELELYRH